MSNPIFASQLKGIFENQVFNAMNGVVSNIPNETLRKIASRVAETTATQTIRLVSQNANKNITDIPKALVGQFNPVNLVTGNLGSAGVSNNLNNLLGTQVTQQINNLIINELSRELRTILPPGVGGIVNTSAIVGRIAEILAPTVSTGITSSLKNFTDSIFGVGGKTPATVNGLTTILSSITSPFLGILESNKVFSTSIALKGLTQSRNFNVNSTDNKNKLAVTKQGFTDPTANYPTKEYAKGPETNKLARGEIQGTIIQKKNDERMIGAPLPNGSTWEQPISPYKGEYPYNKVTETEAGHIIEVDDTPGAERIHVFHKSGTFVEIDNTGSLVQRIKGSSYTIVDRNGKIFIQGTADVSVKGAINVYVAQDATVEVKGNASIAVYQDINARAGGNVNISAQDSLNLISANVYIEALENFNIKSNALLSMHVSKDLHVRSNANAYVQATTYYQNTTNSYNQTIENSYEKHGKSRFIQSAENIHVKSTGTYNTQSGGVMNFKSGSTYNMQSAAAMNLKAGGNINEDGALIYLNSGTAGTAGDTTDSKDSKPARIADRSLAGMLNTKVLAGSADDVLAPNETEVKDPVAANLGDSYSVLLDEEIQTSKEYNAHKDKIVLSGITTNSDFSRAPVVARSESVSSQQTNTVSASNDLKSYNVLPGNFNLSPNFTVEMLSDKTSYTKSIIKTTNNIKYGTVIFNLSSLALNILEPILLVYPDLQIVSAYRTPNLAPASSLHTQGKAVDIQFQGLSYEEYFDRSIQLARVLNYDQFILHYCSYAKSPWIHISYQGSNNRRQISTFWNNKKHSSGLKELR